MPFSVQNESIINVTSLSVTKGFFLTHSNFSPFSDFGQFWQFFKKNCDHFLYVQSEHSYHFINKTSKLNLLLKKALVPNFSGQTVDFEKNSN